MEKSCQQGSAAQNLAGRRSAPDICGKQSPRTEWQKSEKKVKIGDKIIIVSMKCGDGEQKGTVVGIYRSFVTVKLKNGVCESVSWLKAMKLNKKLGGVGA